MDMWALRKVMQDLRERSPNKIHNTLPVKFTLPIVRDIRITACRVQIPTIECAKWTTKFTENAEHGENKIFINGWWTELQNGPRQRTDEYVCGSCNTPKVTVLELMEQLLEKESDAKQVHHTFRRYLNGEVGMIPNTFRKLVVQAFTQQWVGVQDLVWIFEKMDKLEAAKMALIKFCKQVNKGLKKNSLTTDQITEEMSTELMDALRIDYEVELHTIQEAAEARAIARGNSHISAEFKSVHQEWMADRARETEENSDESDNT